MKSINIIILFLVLIFSCTSIAQSKNDISNNILDYYFPKENNKSIFVFSANGKESAFKRNIYYIKNNTSSSIYYETLEENYIPGTTSSIIHNYFKVINNQISLFKSSSTSALLGKKKVDYNPPQIILKLPKIGKIVKWKYKDGDNYECQAEFTKVLIDEVERNAIKVHKKPLLDGKYVDTYSTYDFYVEGIGLWKTQFNDGTDWMILKGQSIDSLKPEN